MVGRGVLFRLTTSLFLSGELDLFLVLRRGLRGGGRRRDRRVVVNTLTLWDAAAGYVIRATAY